ncbi:hypothetical protein B7492_27095 [Bacillus mycoides]|uniref:Uncharacterized protein n=1 Tax=Bacillus mycoides TaxID=1405 RepID=A0A1W6AHN3_BACMY|nr:hypothetical protein B7492_27095 [Bacillus mycoides]
MGSKDKGESHFHRGTSFFVLSIYVFYIYSYSVAVLEFSFVTELAEKLYKILHALSVVFF